MHALARISTIVILLSTSLATPLSSQDGPTGADQDEAVQGEAVQDKAALRRDAQKALLEMLCLGKRDKETNARLQKGMSMVVFLSELGRLKVESKRLARAAEKARASADAEPADASSARKQAVDAMMTALLEADAATTQSFCAFGKSAGEVLAKFRKHLDGMRRGQVASFVNRAMQSGARYIGQFEMLKSLGPDVLDIGLDLLEDPRGLDDRFRAMLVIAMRDFVREPKMTEAQHELLMEIVEDEFEDPAVVHNAIGLLAYGGHLKPYEAKVASLVQAAEKATGADALRQYSALVNLQSIAERNTDATATYRKILELAKDEDPRVVGTHYYNLACSLEKTGNRDEAIEALDAALERTASTLAQGTLWVDRDIAKIREDARFDELLEKHELEWPKALRPKPKGDPQKGEAGKGDPGKGNAVKGEKAKSGK